MGSFCLENTVSRSKAIKDLQSILLPVDKVIPRDDGECFEVVTSRTERLTLIETFLGRRHQLRFEKVKGEAKDLGLDANCRIEFYTTKSEEQKGRDISLGLKKVKAEVSKANKDVVEVKSLILQPQYSGKIGMNDTEFEVMCRKLPTGKFILTLFHGEKSGKVQTEIQLNPDEKMNVGSVVNELNDKKNTLGIPQSEWIKTEGFTNVKYEVLVKN